MKKTLINKVNRLLEDLFAPMSGPEQADIDKQFEDVYTLFAELPREIDQSNEDALDWQFVRSRIRQAIRVAGLIGNRADQSIHSFLDMYYKKTFSNPEDAFSSRGELATKVIKKLDSLKIATSVFEYSKQLSGRQRNIYANDVEIKARNWRNSSQIKPTLLTLSINKERRKKELTEDLFAPMSDVEQAEVDKNFKYRVAVGIAAWKNMDKRLSNKIERMLLANGFKRKKNWGQRVYNWLEKSIRGDVDNYFKVTYSLIMSIMEKELRSPKGNLQRGISYEKSMKITDQLDREVEIYVVVNKKKKSLKEDIFKPMRGKELKDVKKKSELSIEMKQAIVKAVKAEWDAVKDSGSQTGVMMHKYLIHPDTIAQNVFDALGIPYDKERYWDFVYAMVIKYDPFKIAEDIFKPMAGKELKDVKKTLSSRLKVWDLGVLTWNEDERDYVPADRAEVTAKSFEEAKLLFRNAVKRRYGNTRVYYDWYSDQETERYAGVDKKRPMVRWIGTDTFFVRDPLYEDIFKPMGKREVGKADKELIDKTIKKYIKLPPEEALWEILRVERGRRVVGQGIPMSDWAGDRFAGLYKKISYLSWYWEYTTTGPLTNDKRRKEAVAEFKKLSPKLDIRELILKVRGL